VSFQVTSHSLISSSTLVAAIGETGAVAAPVAAGVWAIVPALNAYSGKAGASMDQIFIIVAFPSRSGAQQSTNAFRIRSPGRVYIQGLIVFASPPSLTEVFRSWLAQPG
jgi:hypothetical protein